MTDTTKPALYALTPEQHATVMAALGHFLGLCASLEQRGTPDLRTVTFAHGEQRPLGYKGTDDLFKAMNHTGLEFSAIVPLFAESAEDCPYVRAAQEKDSEGRFEIDEPAVVSKGDDDGAYVMGWMWVSDDDAGLNTYWTIQLDAEIPDGAWVKPGDIIPDEPIWYFGDQLDYERALGYARELGFKYETTTIDSLPDDVEGIDDFDSFKEHAEERAAGRDPV